MVRPEGILLRLLTVSYCQANLAQFLNLGVHKKQSRGAIVIGVNLLQKFLHTHSTCQMLRRVVCLLAHIDRATTSDLPIAVLSYAP
jgi:hypothetical protein